MSKDMYILMQIYAHILIYIYIIIHNYTQKLFIDQPYEDFNISTCHDNVMTSPSPGWTQDKIIRSPEAARFKQRRGSRGAVEIPNSWRFQLG